MSTSNEVLLLIQKKDQKALKLLFETYFSKLSGISLRYAKNATQATALLNNGFKHCYHYLQQQRHQKELDLNEVMENEFIVASVQFIKEIRNEYYVSSTVHATEGSTASYNLFDSQEWVDLNQVNTDVLIQSLQQLVPSQRLIFNLHVVDGKSLNDAANLLESSIETVKSNLEKARYHLQKNIEKNLRK